MNFAALAPGVRLNTNLEKQDFSYGPQGSRNINVFIDGASYKADMLEGGTAGQDSSKGNPFPQNAIQEFRVITQNYKAEYQKASSAIISAVTKSGGNEFHGDLFAFYQNKNLVEPGLLLGPARHAQARVHALAAGPRRRAGRSPGTRSISSSRTKGTTRTARTRSSSAETRGRRR